MFQAGRHLGRMTLITEQIFAVFILSLNCLNLFLIPQVSAGDNPKVFIQTQCIASIEPLRGGLSVELPQDLLDTQLAYANRPTLYVSAIPLNKHNPSFRKSYFDTKFDRINIQGLRAESWYYVCVEFENEHSQQRTGNTSLSCLRRQTLNKFGETRDNLVTQVSLSYKSNASLEFIVEIDVDFPVEIDAYLEGGPRLQSYYLDQPKTFRMSFVHLLPDYNYGRLCILERDLTPEYSSLGRTIETLEQTCYLGDLETLPEPAASHRKRHSASGAGGANSGGSEGGVFGDASGGANTQPLKGGAATGSLRSFSGGFQVLIARTVCGLLSFVALSYFPI